MVGDAMINLMQGDCLDRMKEIEDGSVDLVLTDPPYGTMKGAALDGWGEVKTHWDDAISPSDFLPEINRILRMNGALVLFSQEPYTSRLITETHGNLPFSYRMTWLKDHFANALIAKTAPVSYTEDICVFFKKYDTNFCHPLRDYADRMFDYIGKPRKEIFSEMGHQGAFHWFLGVGSIQFGLCTKKTYDQLCDIYGVDKLPWFRPYAELAEENRRFSRRFSRRFNLPDGQKYKSNVLQYKKDYGGYHPTQKPVALMKDLIRTYTNEGETVLDFTMGSGTTGVACVKTNRKFIGIERDETYFNIAKERIDNAVEEEKWKLI